MGRNNGGVKSSRAGTKSGTVKKATRQEIESTRQQIIALNKQLTSAQAQVTKATNKVASAMGGVYVAQNAQAKADAEAKYQKAVKAQTLALEKYESISSEHKALVSKYKKMVGD